MKDATNAKEVFPMRRTQQLVTLLVSVSILMTMAASPKVADASYVENEAPDPPMAATGSLTVTAAAERPPYLWELTDEPRKYITGNVVVREFDVHDLPMDTVALWSWAWCATTASRLQENWGNIALSYAVDGDIVQSPNFRTGDSDNKVKVPGHGVQTGKCKISYVALWPDGDHELVVEAIFNTDVDDGWNIYPAGTIFRDVYRVTVIEPVGIEHLGDAKYGCYFIEGSNGTQLADDMRRKGPMNGHAWAEARWTWDIRGRGSHPGDPADLSDVRVTVNPTITVPCWYPPASTSLAEIAKFDVFMRQVARHELTHVEIVQKHARILEQRLKDSNTRNAAKWDEITEQVLADESDEQDAFHDSAVGKPIPYP